MTIPYFYVIFCLNKELLAISPAGNCTLSGFIAAALFYLRCYNKFLYFNDRAEMVHRSTLSLRKSFSVDILFSKIITELKIHWRLVPLQLVRLSDFSVIYKLFL